MEQTRSYVSIRSGFGFHQLLKRNLALGLQTHPFKKYRQSEHFFSQSPYWALTYLLIPIHSYCIAVHGGKVFEPKLSVSLYSEYQNPNGKKAEPPQHSWGSDLLPQRLFLILFSHYWCSEIKSSGFIPMFTAAQRCSDGWRQSGPPPSPALRKHTSVYAAFPSSLGVIYWTGAGCHCWVIAVETVTHSVTHSGMWEACGIHTGILFHCCNTLTVQSSTLSASGCIINAHEGVAGNQCHSGSKTEIFCIS